MTSPYGQQPPPYPPHEQYPPQQPYPPQQQYHQQPPVYPQQHTYPPQPAYDAPAYQPPGYQPPGYQPGPTPPPPPARAWWQRKRVLIPAGVIALLIVVGLVNGAGDPAVTPAGTSDAAGAAAAPAADAPVDDGIATFGERLTLPSGMAFEVATPAEYQPGQYAAGHDRERAVIVEITVINGTSAPYEFNPFIVGPTATHDSRPAPEIIDFQSEEVGVTAVSTILPGSSLTYRVALSIGANAADLQLELRESVFDDPGLFVGQV